MYSHTNMNIKPNTAKTTVTFLLTPPGPHSYAIAKGFESDDFLTSFDHHDFKHLHNDMSKENPTTFVHTHCYKMIGKAITEGINYMCCDQYCATDLFMMALQCEQIQHLVEDGKLNVNVIRLAANIDDCIVWRYDELRNYGYKPTLSGIKDVIDADELLFKEGIRCFRHIIKDMDVLSSNLPNIERNFYEFNPNHLLPECVKAIAISCGKIAEFDRFNEGDRKSMEGINAMLNDKEHAYMGEVIAEMDSHYGGMTDDLIRKNYEAMEDIVRRIDEQMKRENAGTKRENNCHCSQCEKKRREEGQSKTFPVGSNIEDILNAISGMMKK